MSTQDRIDDIAGLLREAELDEEVWSAASALIDDRPPGTLIHTDSLLSEEVRRTSATYNEYLVPNAGENCLNALLPGVGDLQVAWSLVGPGGGAPGDWTDEQVQRWHIREALGRLGLARQADLVRVVLSTPGVLDDGD